MSKVILFLLILKKKSHIADYMIIASGTSSKHIQSLSENLILELKKTGNLIIVEWKVKKVKIGSWLMHNRYYCAFISS